MRDLELGAPEQDWLLGGGGAEVNAVGGTWQDNAIICGRDLHQENKNCRAQKLVDDKDHQITGSKSARQGKKYACPIMPLAKMTELSLSWLLVPYTRPGHTWLCEACEGEEELGVLTLP
jgi:hypothetical protein